MERTVKARLVINGRDQVVTVKVPVSRDDILNTELIRRAGNALREAADSATYTVEEL